MKKAKGLFRFKKENKEEVRDVDMGDQFIYIFF